MLQMAVPSRKAFYRRENAGTPTQIKRKERGEGASEVAGYICRSSQGNEHHKRWDLCKETEKAKEKEASAVLTGRTESADVIVLQLKRFIPSGDEKNTEGYTAGRAEKAEGFLTEREPPNFMKTE